MHQRVRGRERLPRQWRAAPRAVGRADDEVKGLVHTFVCPACHAILKDTAWYVDEEEYKRLDGQPGVWPALCPGCLRVVRGVCEGEVVLQSPLLLASKAAALELISKEEERARVRDPLARLTSLQDHGDEIRVQTTTALLAERIGKAFRKALDGTVEVWHLTPDKVHRVRWHRD